MINVNLSRSPLQQFIGDIVVYLPAAVLPAFFVMLGSYFFTRLFTPDEYGLYSISLAFVVPITVLLTNWAIKPANRFYAEYKQKNEDTFYYQVVLQLSFLLAAIALLSSVILFTILWLFNGTLEQPIILFGACLVVLANTLIAIPLAVLPARMRAKAYSQSLVMISFLNLCFSFSFVYFISRNVGWLLWGQALANIFLIPYVYWRAGIQLHKHVQPITITSLKMLHRFWRYGNPMMFWFLAITLLEVGDRYIIHFFLGSSAVGIYSINYMFIAGLSGFLIGPMTWAAGPIIFQKWGAGLTGDLELVISHMTRIFMVFGFIFLAGTIALGKPAVQLLIGAEFHQGTKILVPVMLGQICLGAATIGNKGLELYENTRLLMWDAIIAAFVNIFLNLLFVPQWGYLAAAYTTLISYGVYTLLIWRQSRDYIPWRVNTQSWWPYILYAIVAMLLTIGITELFTNLYVSLIVGGLVLVSTYTALILLSNKHSDLLKIVDISVQEREKV